MQVGTSAGIALSAADAGILVPRLSASKMSDDGHPISGFGY
jgi:hypothetical protein